MTASTFLSEADIEHALLNQLRALNYTIEREENIGPDGLHPERESHDVVILKKRLENAVSRFNPHIPLEAQQEAIRKITQSEFPSLIEENRRIHQLITEGIDVEYTKTDGTLTAGKVTLIDFEHPEKNDCLAVNQFVVILGTHHRRPDVVIFINGLPLAVIELKAPGSDAATMLSAFNQLKTYQNQISALFYTNALLIISDGITARFGSLTADFERFMPWRTIDGKNIAPKGEPELSVLMEGIFQHAHFLDILKNFMVFGEKDNHLIKIIAGYHQFHAVRHAITSTLKASAIHGDKRAGVMWHTQGSGKSLLMAFYAGQLVKHAAMENPTIIVLTDRNDLDEQLFATFSMCRDLIRQTPICAESREDLKKILNRASGGVIFTTIQKFSPENNLSEYPILTNRRNVIVIADEAHRSQYGFRAKINKKTAIISYGFAKYLRDALPKASFIGFTGTPIEATDVNTPAIFGNYIDIYDISRAVEDGATVPIYYESRLARIEFNKNEKPAIDAEVATLTEGDPELEQEQLKKKWSTIEALIGNEKRLTIVAKDIIEHFENRIIALDGKAMIVCMSRRIAVKLYDEIIQLRRSWHNTNENEGEIKVVMTGSASDPQTWQQHIRNKKQRTDLAKRMRDAKDPLKIVIVCDMWLTGFDAPCLHTMYLDKSMKGHDLMQAITRVNRVFRDKPAGLIVDYIGIAQNLKSALQQYSKNDQEKTGIDESKAIAVMMEKYEIVRGMFHGFNYQSVLTDTPQARLKVMAEAIEWILNMQHQLASKEKTDEGRRNAHRRYQDAVLALSKSFSLASASDEAKTIREELGFFQAIRVAFIKTASHSGIIKQEKELAIQQIISRAVISTEIIDILSATGIQSPDISIFSDEFLAEVQQMKQKNLALEALKKLINDGIRSRSKANIVQTKLFSERLENAVARYHANAITTAEMLEKLIELAKDISAARQRGEESGLSDEEIAFYDALAKNESAVEMMGDDKLRLIAHELLKSLRENVSVDWAHRESARARLRVLVKKILRTHGYPPDLQDAAVQTVLQQAEALSSEWVMVGNG